MAIVFPASPNVNEIFTEASITYKWDGDKWIGLGTTPADRLVEGSNSLEINAGNDLVWTGDNIGIGTNVFTAASSGRQIVEIEGASSSLINLTVGGARKAYHFTDGTDVYSYNTAIGSYIFGTSDTEKLRIASDGKLTAKSTHSNGAVNDALRITTTGTYSSSNSIDAGPAISFGQFDGDYPTWTTAQIAGIRKGTNWDGALAFYTNSGSDQTAISEKLRINSDGDMGLGTTSPTSDGGTTFEIYDASTPTLRLNDGGDYKALFQLRGNDLEIRGSNGLMEFYTGSADGASSTEKFRIGSAGQIGLSGANYGTSGQVITSNGSGSAPTWQNAGGGGGGGAMEYISTQTVSSSTAQVEFDLSNTNYDFFIVKAYGCKFTAAPSNGYCVYFNVYDGAYNSGNAGTNRMSVRYQRSQHDGSSITTSASWAYDLTLFLGWTPTTSANFSFNAEIGGKTNSPICITSNFLEGTTTSSGCPSINGVAPNSSNNMTYMTVRPSTTTFASGTFLLYGIKNS